jgi:hypothetical protein
VEARESEQERVMPRESEKARERRVDRSGTDEEKGVARGVVRRRDTREGRYVTWYVTECNHRIIILGILS